MEKQLGMVPDMLLPTYMAKSLEAMKAPWAVKCITFECSEASPGETLYVSVPKLNENEVLSQNQALPNLLDPRNVSELA